MTKFGEIWRLYKQKGKPAFNQLLPRALLYGSFGVPVVLLGFFFLLLTSLTEEGLFEDKVQQFANILESDVDFKARHASLDLGSGGNPGITVIEVDDTTLNWLGKRIETRDFIYCLVNRIASLQPRAIGLDYLFFSAYDFADYGTTVQCPNGEEIDIQAFDALGVPVVVAGQRARNPITREWRLIGPGPAILSPDSQSRGHMGFSELSQGILVNQAVRAQSLVMLDQQEPLGAFSLALAAMGEGKLDDDTSWRGFLQEKKQALLDEPDRLSSLGESVLRYPPPERLFESISAYAVFFSKAPEPAYAEILRQRFRDDYILIGNTAVQTEDVFDHPLSTAWPLMPSFLTDSATRAPLPGIYIHGYTLWNILSDSFLSIDRDWNEASQLFFLAIPFVLYFIFTLVFGALSWKGWQIALCFALSLVALFWMNQSVLHYFDIPSAINTPVISLLAGGLIAVLIFFAYPVPFTVLAILLAGLAQLFHNAVTGLVEDGTQTMISNRIVWTLLAYLVATLLFAMYRIMRESSMADLLKRHNSNEKAYTATFGLKDRIDRDFLLKPHPNAVGCRIAFGEPFNRIQLKGKSTSRQLATLQGAFENTLHDIVETFFDSDEDKERKVAEDDYLVMIDNYGQNSLDAYVFPVSEEARKQWKKDIAERLAAMLENDQRLKDLIRLIGRPDDQSACWIRATAGELQILDIPSRAESGVLTACGPLVNDLSKPPKNSDGHEAQEQ